MFQGFFELKTAQDLLDKLKREYIQLQKSPLNQDIAFNLFITAEHIPDWIYPDVENKYNDKKLKEINEEFGKKRQTSEIAIYY